MEQKRPSGEVQFGSDPPRSDAPIRKRVDRIVSVSMSAEQIRKGLPMKAVYDVARVLNVDHALLADLLGTSVRTLQRKAGERARLGPVASDRLARVNRILDLATHVLGEQDKAARWLTSQSRTLGGEVPLRMLDTDIGTQRVEQELRQIEFGMPF